MLVPSAKTSNTCARRVIAPDAGVERRALVVGRARLADVRVREHAVAAVEPAVRAPGERVERLVRVLVAPAVEQDLAAAGRPIVAVLDRDEQQVRGAAPTHTPPKPTSMPLTRFSPSMKTLRLVELAVAVGVLEDQDAVLALALGRAVSG